MERVKKSVVSFVLIIAVSICSIGVNTKQADAFILGWVAKKAAKAVVTHVAKKAVVTGVKKVASGVKKGYQNKQKNFKVSTEPRKIYVKQTVRLKPLVCWGNEIKWSSSNKKVAAVSSKGVVTGKKAGTAVITAVPSISKKISKIKVTVKAYPKSKKKKGGSTKTKAPATQKSGNNKKSSGSSEPGEIPVVSSPSHVEEQPTMPPEPTVQPEATVPPESTQTPEPEEPTVSPEATVPPEPEETKEPMDEMKSEDEFIVTEVRYGDDAFAYEQDGDTIRIEMDGDESLKEKIPDISGLKICAALPDAAMSQEAVLGEAVWHEEPYYSSSADNGYYEVIIRILQEGQWFYRSMFLIEEV